MRLPAQTKALRVAALSLNHPAGMSLNHPATWSAVCCYVQVTQKPAGPLTPAQLDRIKELLQTQNSAIAADQAELAALSDQLEAWRLEHPEVDLPARLSRLGTVV